MRELAKGKEIELSGLWGAGKAFQVLRLCAQSGRPAWVVAKGPKEQEAWVEDLRALGELEVLSFPAWEVFPQDEAPPQKEIIAERFDTLRRLLRRASGAPRNDKSIVVVTTVQAMLFRVFAPETFAGMRGAVRRGEAMSKNALLEKLVDLGYDAFPMVGQKGEFSQRGGIVDFYPLNRNHPVRVEFFGNVVESVREFDVASQRTIRELKEESVEILPAGEKERLLECRPSELALLTEYGSDEFLFFFDEKEEIAQKAAALEGMIADGGILFCLWQAFLKKTEPLSRFALTLLPREKNEETESLQLETRSVESVLTPHLQNIHLAHLDLAHERSKEMMEALAGWREKQFEVKIFCHNEGERERLAELLKQEGKLATLPEMKLGRLSAGFILEKEKKVFLSDAEIFGRYKIRRSRWKFTGSALESSAAEPALELEPGDTVVHVNYGIGRYHGVVTIPVEGVEKEMLEIEYADGARLYVPLLEGHLVERYLGFAEKSPELDKLGGTRWRATKLKVERAIQDYASDLLVIQAERAALEGTAFSSDKPWQTEFEAAFLYEETPDQMQAINAVKGDMQSGRPMDRLICGDVGYGKTEVALRAAFKAVLDGKQVAVLVPTTVLAQQHGQTFSERMADYPVRVETLSRFKSKAEQKIIIEAIEKGEVEIVIGTHRLIQPDVKFKDLGLVIIDEEQRFGVRHKEKLKHLRRLVDVLTLTATPIPRTLYLSLIGVKEMSAIQTPPIDRLPIETHLIEWDDKVIREAILREMNREGQVFFVHNRVQTIEKMKERLHRLVPEAKIDIGHGQMGEGELEMVMQEFVEGNLDVLVSTTIIESGLDIPNANTILIDRADMFGLAELYQLRGRVGRFKHQAYAYLLLPRDKVIVAEAKKRLKAMMEYSSLGAGFKVAMKDLEIRGAGNILGEEQSGHIAAIGFDLYCKLLRKTVERLKGKEGKALPGTKESQIKIGVEGDLPKSYISDMPQRLELFREIGEAETLKMLEGLEELLQDRFGKLPVQTKRLLALAELRLLASQKNLDSVELKENKLYLRRGTEFLTFKGKMLRVFETDPDQVLAAVKKVLLSLD